MENRFKGCIFQCSSIKGPRVFTKLLKVPVSVLRCLMINAIVLLDHLFIFRNTMKEVLMTLGSVIFLLQHLGFIMNFKKYLGTNSGDRVSEYGCKFKKVNVVFNSRKGLKVTNSVSGTVQSTTGNSVRYGKIAGNCELCHSSYPPSTSSVLVPA